MQFYLNASYLIYQFFFNIAIDLDFQDHDEILNLVLRVIGKLIIRNFLT